VRKPTALFTIAVILLSISSLPATATDAQLPPGSNMIVGSALSFSVSPPLREMAVCPGTPASVPSSVEARRTLTAPNFEGIGLAEIAGDNCNMAQQQIADDDSGAVGPKHYVQVVNISLAVYDKAGNRLAGPIATSTFWANQPDCFLGGVTISDSLVIYDRHADRWVISRPGVAGGPDGLCLAVSVTSDPTGRYYQYAFAINTEANGLANLPSDYPKISTWPEFYLATALPNRIYCGVGDTVSAFDRAAMLAGDRAPGYVTFFVPAPVPGDDSPDCVIPPFFVAHTHMLPADLDGKQLPPAGAPGYIVQVQDENWGFPAGRLQIYEIHVDWTDPSSATLIPTTSLTPETFNSNPCPWDNGSGLSCIQQPEGPAVDASAWGAMMYRLSYRNFGSHQTLLFNHTVAADGDPSHRHSGIRWYELRSSKTAPWFIYQQGTYAPDENDRWLGSIAMDRHGDIALGFDVSGANQYPSIHYASRRPSDPLGQLPREEVSIIEGHGAQITSFPWGDYSQMTIDPTDDCTFWYTNEYYPKTTNPDRWHTRIAAFRFSECHARENPDE